MGLAKILHLLELLLKLMLDGSFGIILIKPLLLWNFGKDHTRAYLFVLKKKGLSLKDGAATITNFTGNIIGKNIAGYIAEKYIEEKRPIFNRDDVREPYTNTFLKNAAGKKRKATKGRFSNGKKETTYKAHDKGALPRDVIKISALAGGAGKKERVDHPTQKPLALCEKLIKASKNKDVKNNILLVPFAGSGSECVAAKKLGVNFLAYEINPTYIELCNTRLNAD